MPQRSASRLDYLKSWPLYPLPHHAISRLTFQLTRIQTPWFKNLLIRWFAGHYQVDWSEALHGHPEDYLHFNDFFTRALHEGARPVEGDAATVICPADGHISQAGDIDAGAVFQA
jgi:phosphatidylserine decarboxylase